MKTLLVIGFLFPLFCCFPQQQEIDSLLSTYHQRDEIDVAKVYANISRAIRLSREYGLRTKESEAHYYLGLLNHKNGELQFALDEYLLAQGLGISPEFQARLFDRIGVIYYEFGNYNHSIEWHLQSLELSKKQENAFALGASYNNIGLVYDDLGDYDKALDYYGLASNTYISGEDDPQIAAIFNNIGSAYFMKELYDSSLIYYQKSYQLREKNGIGYNSSLNNLGLIYTTMNMPDSATYYLLRGVENNRKSNNLRGLTLSLNSLGELYADQEENVRALESWKEAYDLSVQSDFLNAQSSILANLANLEENLNHNKSALQYLKLKIEVDKALSKDEKLKQIERAITRQKLENQRVFHLQELEASKTQFEGKIFQSNLQRNILLFLGITLLVLVIILYSVLMKSRRKSHKIEVNNAIINAQNKRLNKLNITKENMFSIIAHDLRSPLVSLKSYLKLQQDSAFENDPDEQQEQSKRMNHSLDNVLELMDNLLAWSSGSRERIRMNLGKMHLFPVVSENIRLMDVAIQAKELSIELNVDSDVQIIADKNMMSTVIRNVLNNAVKFSPIGGIIRIQHQLKGDYHCINVIDQGPGVSLKNQERLFVPGEQLKKSEESGSGLGLIICHDFLERHNGSISYINTTRGANFEIQIPVRDFN